MNLLIVNDEINTALTMKVDITWKQYGIDQVYTAFNTEEARNVINNNAIDLMLCDIEMPGENGISLLRWVREQNKDIECIFLTCHASFAYAQEAISLGCSNYILIPAKYEDIGEQVYKLVQKIKERRKNKHFQEFGKYYIENEMNQVTQKEDNESSSPQKTTEKICTYILEHLSDPTMTVDGIAEEMHFHPVYMNRFFRKIKGQSVSQYIMEQRMAAAGQMIADGKLSIREISIKVGYSNYNNFYIMFKKCFGVSPAQYQDEHGKKV